MKFQKLIALFFLSSSTIFGQQTFQFTQYYFNKFLYNPAFAGFEDYVDIKSGYRSQWSGLGANNQTFYLTANMAIDKKDITSNGPTPYISSTKRYAPKPTRLRVKENKSGTHQGVGIQIISDQWGPVNTLAISATYAFHISLGGERKIGAGFSIGNYNRLINLSPGSFDVSDPSDKLLNADGKLSVNHNLINLGATYYDRSNYIGLAAVQPIMDTFNYTSKNDDTTKTNNSFGQMPSLFIVQAGLAKELNEDIKIYPTTLIKYINSNQWTAELTLRAMVKEMVWAGLSYRLKESAAIHAGARLSPGLLVNYSYDFQGSFGPFARSLHSNEITIAYMFYKKGIR